MNILIFDKKKHLKKYKTRVRVSIFYTYASRTRSGYVYTELNFQPYWENI